MMVMMMMMMIRRSSKQKGEDLKVDDIQLNNDFEVSE